MNLTIGEFINVSVVYKIQVNYLHSHGLAHTELRLENVHISPVDRHIKVSIIFSCMLSEYMDYFFWLSYHFGEFVLIYMNYPCTFILSSRIVLYLVLYLIGFFKFGCISGDDQKGY